MTLVTHSDIKVWNDYRLWRKLFESRCMTSNIEKLPSFCSYIKFGIRDMSSVPLSNGKILPKIPQLEEDRAFGIDDFDKGLKNGIYEEAFREYVFGESKKPFDMLICICGLVRRRCRTEGLVCIELSSAKQALAERKHQDGEGTRFCSRDGKRICHVIFRYESRI